MCLNTEFFHIFLTSLCINNALSILHHHFNNSGDTLYNPVSTILLKDVILAEFQCMRKIKSIKFHCMKREYFAKNLFKMFLSTVLKITTWHLQLDYIIRNRILCITITSVNINIKVDIYITYNVT